MNVALERTVLFWAVFSLLILGKIGQNINSQLPKCPLKGLQGFEEFLSFRERGICSYVEIVGREGMLCQNTRRLVVRSLKLQIFVKKITVLLFLVFLLTGCDANFNLFEMEHARPMQNDDDYEVKYTFSRGIGSFEGDKYIMMGRQANDFAFVVSGITDKISVSKLGKYESFPHHRGIRIWLWNYSNGPIQNNPNRFIMVSPEGKVFTHDFDLQWDMNIYRNYNEAITSSITLQPDQRTYIRL